jgi:hypothetical protein
MSVNTVGRRELLGLQVGDSESEGFWKAFIGPSWSVLRIDPRAFLLAAHRLSSVDPLTLRWLGFSAAS